jgi:hypothetical protein
MPCARKRLHERWIIAIDEIAFRMGYLCKRVLAFDLGTMSQAKFDAMRRVQRRSRSPDESKTSRVRGKDVTFWSQKAATLSADVVQLREEAGKHERDYSSLTECNVRLITSYKAMERKLSDAERELLYLRTDPFRESRGYTSVISTIPLNTEGRDALYWHQTCRTMQAQYLEVKHEMDEKTNQFILLSNRIRELESLLRDQ